MSEDPARESAERRAKAFPLLIEEYGMDEVVHLIWTYGTSAVEAMEAIAKHYEERIERLAKMAVKGMR